MDFNSNSNQSSQAQGSHSQYHYRQDQPQPQQGGRSNKHSKQNKRSLRFRPEWLSSILLAIAVIIMVIFGILWLTRGGSDEASQVNKNEYQAVFLNNGQVYFGKIKSLNNSYIKLTNIFYLHSKQAPQPKSDSVQQAPGDLSLVKLGNEIHGPEDAMVINRDQVEFWENLKTSGKVAKAISQYYANGGNTSTNSSTPSETSNSNTPAPESTNSNSNSNSNNNSTTQSPSNTNSPSNSSSTPPSSNSTSKNP